MRRKIHLAQNLQILGSLDSTGAPFRKCLHLLGKICSSRTVLPPSYELSGELSFSTHQEIAYGGFCDVYKGARGSAEVCIKRFRVNSTDNQEKVKQVYRCYLLLACPALTISKALCREAVVWKHLDHPNIVPFRGVTFQPLQLVSDWIPGGELREYINKNSQANLISVVSLFIFIHNQNLILFQLLGAAKGLAYLHSRNVVHGDIKGVRTTTEFSGLP